MSEPQQLCVIRDKQIVLIHDGGSYPIDFDRCDTPQKVLGWIAHLCAKEWVTRKHLKRFIQEAAENNNFEIDRDA